ncbi:hypothetical protein Ancab_012613 [Ancistrocladus abbreviatus]
MMLKSFFPSFCFKAQLPNPESKRVEPKQCSPQRISLLDVSNPGSEMSIHELPGSLVGSKLHVFTHDELRKITNNFSSCNYIGEGGFGVVYKGFIDDKFRPCLEAQAVAVKVLDLEGSQGHKEWLAEVIFLGQLRHHHLVKLIGYCCENDQRLLVYEYLPRGSLYNQLFKRSSVSLPWLTRMKIAVEAAKGLAYLHEANKPVIVRDFKAANILLDTDYTAKLSDFGFARDGPGEDKTHITTKNIIGTKGYAAPEYVMTGHLTTLSDVYSFGVVLLELLTGRQSMDKTRPRREQSLVECARPFLKDPNKIDRFMDPRLEGQYSHQAAKIAAMVAYQCLSHRAKSRPPMSAVVKTLEPLMKLEEDIPGGPFVYIVPSDQNKKEYHDKKNTAEEVEDRKVEKENNGYKKPRGHRHRHRMRHLRSHAVYSDNTLYRPQRNMDHGEDPK